MRNQSHGQRKPVIEQLTWRPLQGKNVTRDCHYKLSQQIRAKNSISKNLFTCSFLKVYTTNAYKMLLILFSYICYYCYLGQDNVTTKL